MAKTQEPGVTKIEGIRGVSYRVQIRIKNGKHLSKNYDTFKEAKEWKRKTIAAVKAGDPYETTQMRRPTFKDLIDCFIENELKKLRNHKTMLGHHNWFKEEIGHISSKESLKLLLLHPIIKNRIDVPYQFASDIYDGRHAAKRAGYNADSFDAQYIFTYCCFDIQYLINKHNAKCQNPRKRADFSCHPLACGELCQLVIDWVIEYE